MTGVGYAAARQTGDAVAAIVRDMARLVGPVETEPVELESGRSVVPGLGMGEDARYLQMRAQDLEAGLFKIIVLGEFKNGKSTLLNAMLGNKTLPAKAAPATAIITILVYGDSNDVAIFENGRRQPQLLDWESFVRKFQLTRADQETMEGHGFVDRFRDIDYALIECRHPICASGVKLIDSPGLGEHVSRTRVATEFLKQSQAAIFVLNATKILSDHERQYIDEVLGSGRLEHVFFVVNRINQVDEESIQEIRTWVENGLRPHFLDERGSFDRDLYDRRVFYLDAKGALDQRMQPPADVGAVEATGVPALERELERFLTGEEKIQAALGSTAALAGPIVLRAQGRIAGTLAALDQPLEELEARRAEAERRLDRLGGRKREIERTILVFGDTVKHKVYAGLLSYVEEMRDSWSEDAQRMIDLDRIITLKSLLTSQVQEEARERMALEVAEQVQEYLRIKFTEWAARVPATIDTDLQRMMAEVEAQVEDIQVELNAIAALFAAVPPRKEDRERTSARLLNAALGLSELGGMVHETMKPGDWTETLGKMAQQAVLVLVLGTLFTGSIFSALLIVEVVHLIRHGGEVRKRVREGLSKRLFDSLSEQVRERQGTIHAILEGRFADFAHNMTEAIDTQIREIREEQERIIRQKRDTSFSVDQEKERLSVIGTSLTELEGQLGGIVRGSRQASIA